MANGEPSGFAEFVTARYGGLVRTAYLIIGDRGHAEDLVQTALFRTFRAWDRLRAIEAADAYTRTTMVRLAGHWSRRRWRGEIVTAEVSTIAGHVAAADATITAMDVRAALGRLPWAQRAVLVLRFFDDLPEAEVARLLHCSVGTVKSRASRGLAALRAAELLGSSTTMEVRHG